VKGNKKFYICERCKNFVNLVDNRGGTLVCCDIEMTELTPNTVEASVEKHLPEVKVSGNEVQVEVGSVLHPMEDAHYISFIYLETENGGQYRTLKPGEEPKATFSYVGEKPLAVYEYCNLHGLWKTEIK